MGKGEEGKAGRKWGGGGEGWLWGRVGTPHWGVGCIKHGGGGGDAEGERGGQGR